MSESCPTKFFIGGLGGDAVKNSKDNANKSNLSVIRMLISIPKSLSIRVNNHFLYD